VKVLCVKIINPATLQEVAKHPAVRLLDEYYVLSILVVPGRGAKFQILDSDGEPSWWDAAMFATVDDTIPSNWVCHVTEGGVVELAPGAWLEVGFWDRFFDGEPDAKTRFERELPEVLGMLPGAEGSESIRST
jgi:hypothetical protein